MNSAEARYSENFIDREPQMLLVCSQDLGTKDQYLAQLQRFISQFLRSWRFLKILSSFVVIKLVLHNPRETFPKTMGGQAKNDNA